MYSVFVDLDFPRGIRPPLNTLPYATIVNLGFINRLGIPLELGQDLLLREFPTVILDNVIMR